MLEDITARREAEQALRDSESRLGATIGAIGEMVFVWDDAGRFVDAHLPAGARTLAKREEFLGLHYEKVLPPAVAAQLTAAMRALSATGGIQCFDYELTLDGEPTWWSASVSKRCGPDGAEIGVVGIVREITARKSAERELVESREKYFGLFNTVSEAIYVHGTDGVFLDVNEGAAPMLGFSVRSWSARLRPRSRPRAATTSRKSGRYARRRSPPAAPQNFEFWGRRKNGEAFRRPRHPPGQVFWAGCADHDGARHHRAQGGGGSRARAGRPARRHPRRHSGAGLGSHRHLLQPRFRDSLRREGRGEALGRRYESIAYRDVPPEYDAEWQAFLECGEWSRERRQIARERGEIVVRMRATLVRDGAGRPQSALIVVTDITEAKRLEAQFLRAQRLESLGSLASGLAHDLNNVLTPVLISAGLLAETVRTPRESDLLRLLTDNARRGADLLQQLLLFGRGGNSPRAPMAVSGVVAEMDQIMRETFPRNIAIACSIPKSLWMIDADRTQVHQVLLNLCVNARDAMPGGGELSIMAENVVIDPEFARGQVGAIRPPCRHSGKGQRDRNSSGEYRKNIRPVLHHQETGPGLGPGSCDRPRNRARPWGVCTVESGEGEGSEFAVYFPARESAVEADAGDLPRPSLRGQGELVLVIDDEQGIREGLAKVLGHYGYEVATASDGCSGVAAFEKHSDRVRIVLTDMMMPVMDGPAAIRALRKLRPELPIIAMSGLPAHRTQLEFEFGPRLRFLPKPFLVENVLSLVRDLLAAIGPPDPDGRA